MELKILAIYIIFNNLGENRGGLSRAVYDRISVLSKLHRVIILNFSLGSDQLALFKKIAKKEGWLENVEHSMVFHRSPTSKKTFLFLLRKTLCVLLLAPAIRRIKFGPHGLKLISWNKDRPTQIIFINNRAILLGGQESKLAAFLKYLRVIEQSGEGADHLYSEVLQPYKISQNDTLFIEESDFICASNGLECRKFFYLHEDHLDGNNEVKPNIVGAITQSEGVTTLVATRDQRERLNKVLGLGYQVLTLPHYTQKRALDCPKKQRAIVAILRINFNAKPIKELVSSIAAISPFFRDGGIAFNFYGLGPDTSKLAQLILDLGISDFVSLNGYTNRPEEVFAQSLASVFPSFGEGFGLSALESLSCGCPVISSDVRYGPQEMIQDELRVDVGSPEALLSALEKVIGHPDGYRRDALKAAALYSVDGYEDRLRSLLNGASL